MRAHASRRPRGIAVFTAALLLGGPLYGQHAAPPGFRPPSPLADSFVESLPGAELAVLPTLVRGIEGISYSLASQRRIVDLLNDAGVARATPVDRRIDLGAAPHESQWSLFQGALQTVAAELESSPVSADYTLAMEVLFEPGKRVVFGIHSYLLDREGRNVFSFLLNSHHEVFASAHLVVTDDTEEARAALIDEATRVGIGALEAQIEAVRECAAWTEAHPPLSMEAGVFEDFQAGLHTGRDAAGIPLGFSTFTDGPSTVSLGTTGSHPTRPGEPEGNLTLQVDLDVTGWAGFTDLTRDGTTPTWRPQDWTGAEGLSFWLYGGNTGTQLFVDVLDNRNPCSTVDDAERYVYEFRDDFSGWKKIVIPFREMVRKEIGNGAPEDGLNLSRVHGWAFGATATHGPRTWYLDDVELWRPAPGDCPTGRAP